MEFFACPYLGEPVELTDERARHIREEHPALLPWHPEWIAAALADPAEVRRRSWRGDQLVFVRETEVDDLVAVVVVRDEPRDDIDPGRRWIVTASSRPPRR